ncbi:MAG: trypsin-like peptidase domain-containing protein [Clostridia bacterium]|nr:trypsin-like peptidase domain-containing protein [Clostridia bacterium]
MKKKGISLRILALACALIVTALSMTSCMLLLPEEDYMTEEEVKALISGTMSGDTTIGNVNEYEITIENNGSANLSAATKGVLSTVSIAAQFTISYGYGGTSNATSSGAGVIYQLDKEKGDAYIITNYHVVYDVDSKTSNKISNNINVYLYGQESSAYAIPATYVGGAMSQDLAILKVTGSRVLAESNACAVSFADPDDISILDTAIAIGNPAADGISATVGYVNVDSEYVSITAADGRSNITLRLLRIDTAVNSGNSGGGLFNDRGELIGIVNAKITSSSIDNIAYAIPSGVVSGVAENIIRYCASTELENPYKYSLGITMNNSELYTEYDEETGKIHKREVVKVDSIEAGSLASSLFEKGDVISAITVDGERYEIHRMYQVVDCMLSVFEDSELSFDILRGGEKMTISVDISGIEPKKVV